jgi:hypothetical protein
MVSQSEARRLIALPVLKATKRRLVLFGVFDGKRLRSFVWLLRFDTREREYWS